VANAAGRTVTLQLNDPKITGLHDSTGADTGHFSNGQSPDNRVSVDQDNPTGTADVDGTIRNRWVTPFEMTGENAAPGERTQRRHHQRLHP
jgi:hypothetical protein